MEAELVNIENSCKAKVCVTRKGKVSRKPVVALPRASQFGEVLTLDLKLRHKKRPILYMIDAYTRLTLGEIIENKECETVTCAIMKRWVGGGYPAPTTIHSDNGGEFSGKDMINLAENLNANVTTTAAYSPFQNGVNERGHAVVDCMMTIMMEENKELDEEVALFWSCYAKNSLHMFSGFSSFQLVFGRNPPLPCNITNQPPALENKRASEAFSQHLTALHAAREAFTKVESDERLRRALRHNIRPTGDVKSIGDLVFFKRMGKENWRGPGKVVGIEGKNILVKQSSWTYNVRSDDAIIVNPTLWGVDGNKAEKRNTATTTEDNEDVPVEELGGEEEPLGHDCSSLLPGDSGGSRKGQPLGHDCSSILPGDS